MRILFSAIAVSLLMSFPAGAQTYDELCKRAYSAIDNDSLKKAEEYIREALRLDPANIRNALLFTNLGTVQYRRGHYREALESYTYALNMAPRTSLALINRGALYLELGEMGKARADYSLALDVDADNEEALNMRAYIYTEEGEYKSARADYERLLKLSPESFSGRIGLAILNQKEKKYEEAILILNGMINEKAEGTSSLVAPQHAVVYTARAGVEKDMGNEAMALMDLNEAIRLDKSRPEAYLMRGQIYLSQQQKQLAKADFEKAVLLGIPEEELEDLLQQCK